MYTSHNTSKFTVAMGNFFSRLLMVWDQKFVNSVRVAVGPVIGAYEFWNVRETTMLIRLFVDGIKQGWRDKNGSMNKMTILPNLNATLGCHKTHKHYLKTGEAVWDQKIVNNLRGAVKPSTSRPARQYRISPWKGSEDSKSTQWDRNAIIDAFFR
ncbi:hypothetical protein HID58_039968 [Brassica napus]|uniref:Uncharacterized protein n=1 Tax=Brassica napus TaxID=3708 RepID=A0ABQ8B6N6_BRANA|nr:hypothetical protein HID58_039968 [Brassica napus]